MRVTLDVVMDTWNSYPHDTVDFIITDTMVHISMTILGEDDRELSFEREEFAGLLRLISNESH